MRDYQKHYINIVGSELLKKTYDTQIDLTKVQLPEVLLEYFYYSSKHLNIIPEFNQSKFEEYFKNEMDRILDDISTAFGDSNKIVKESKYYNSKLRKELILKEDKSIDSKCFLICFLIHQNGNNLKVSDVQINSIRICKQIISNIYNANHQRDIHFKIISKTNKLLNKNKQITENTLIHSAYKGINDNVLFEDAKRDKNRTIEEIILFDHFLNDLNKFIEDDGRNDLDGIKLVIKHWDFIKWFVEYSETECDYDNALIDYLEYISKNVFPIKYIYQKILKIIDLKRFFFEHVNEKHLLNFYNKLLDNYDYYIQFLNLIKIVNCLKLLICQNLSDDTNFFIRKNIVFNENSHYQSLFVDKVLKISDCDKYAYEYEKIIFKSGFELSIYDLSIDECIALLNMLMELKQTK